MMMMLWRAEVTLSEAGLLASYCGADDDVVSDKLYICAVCIGRTTCFIHSVPRKAATTTKYGPCPGGTTYDHLVSEVMSLSCRCPLVRVSNLCGPYPWQVPTRT